MSNNLGMDIYIKDGVWEGVFKVFEKNSIFPNFLRIFENQKAMHFDRPLIFESI